jgi:hypothetical protein
MTILYFSAPKGLKSSNIEHEANEITAHKAMRLRTTKRGARRARTDALGFKAASVIR